MSAITRILHDAMIRERYIDDLFSQLPRTPDPAERRSLLAKIETLRSQRDPAMCAWLRAEIDKEETSQTDRELLELAARAAGLTIDPVDSYIPSGGLWIVGAGGRDMVWDPLHDDAAAFRLAISLQIDFRRRGYEVSVFGSPSGRIDVVRPDLYYAARYAIVRAAAEIGKAMP